MLGQAFGMPTISSRVVEVCVFSFEKDRPRYLLLRRSKKEALYPDMWQIVTGVVEGDESAIDAARRELAEETQLKPKAFWNVPYASMFYDHVHDVITVSPLFAAQVDTGSEPRLSSEHDEHGWFAYHDALRKLVWPAQRSGLRIVHEYIIGGERAAQFTRIH